MGWPSSRTRLSVCSRPSPPAYRSVRGHAEFDLLHPDRGAILAKTVSAAVNAHALSMRAVLLDIDYSRRTDAPT